MVDLSAIDLNNLIEVDQSQLVLSSSNRAGLGITISKQGLITFQKLLANDLGEDLGTIELKIDKTHMYWWIGLLHNHPNNYVHQQPRHHQLSNL